jgi:hypothetical protein
MSPHRARAGRLAAALPVAVRLLFHAVSGCFRSMRSPSALPALGARRRPAAETRKTTDL